MLKPLSDYPQNDRFPAERETRASKVPQFLTMAGFIAVGAIYNLTWPLTSHIFIIYTTNGASPRVEDQRKESCEVGEKTSGLWR